MRFFFYGTLLARSANPVAQVVHRKLARGLSAIARGTLYAIPNPYGWYPALVPDALGLAVCGSLHEALPEFGADDLALLDTYEHCAAVGGEFRREPIRAEIGAALETTALCYVYARSLPAGARRLPDGDFRAFLRDTGLPEYRDPA